MKYLFSIIIVLLFSCAASKNYEKKLNAWVGHDINELIMAWSEPSSQYNLPNGNKMFTWLYVGNTYVTSNYNWFLNQINTSSKTQYCKTTFTTSRQNKIIQWKWEGNACR